MHLEQNVTRNSCTWSVPTKHFKDALKKLFSKLLRYFDVVYH